MPHKLWAITLIRRLSVVILGNLAQIPSTVAADLICSTTGSVATLPRRSIFSEFWGPTPIANTITSFWWSFLASSMTNWGVASWPSVRMTRTFGADARAPYFSVKTTSFKNPRAFPSVQDTVSSCHSDQGYFTGLSGPDRALRPTITFYLEPMPFQY